MRKILKIAGMVFAGVILAGLGFYGWASYAAKRKLSRTYAVHSVNFPILFSLSGQKHALERGRHLIESRYACAACHGEGFGGGVMVDDPAIGRIWGRTFPRGKEA